MTPKMKLGETQSLDELLAAIRAGVNPQELATRVKELTRPDGDRRLPVPWFRWCREAITADSGGVVRERWLDLNDPLEPLRFVKGALTRLAPHDRWLVAALRLAKLARDKSDIVHDGAMPEEHDGVTEIAEQLGLAGERAALWDLYCDYRDLPRPALAQCRIGLPLVRDDGGVLGELRLALMPEGNGRFYRAHTMAFVKIEDDFRDAAATALAALAGMGRTLPENQDLRWEVRIRATGAVPPALTGPSCGGAFALGMWVLLAGERTDLRTGVLGPLRSEELSGIAITARVDTAGNLKSIREETAKLQDTAKEPSLPRTHTFVVADGQEGLDKDLDDPHAELRVKWIKTIDGAVSFLVQELPRRGFDRAYILDYYAELQRHTGFVGRDWLFERIEALVKSQPSGYLLLRGDKGFGKSAIFAALVRREAEGQGRVGAYHFIHQSGAWDHPLTFFPSLVSQLRRHLALPPLPEEAQPPARSGDPQHLAVLWQQRFKATLSEVSRGLALRGQKLFVLLDAVEDAFPETTPVTKERDLTRWFHKRPPDGLFILLSSCRGRRSLPLQDLELFQEWDLGTTERELGDSPPWQDMDDYLMRRDQELGLGLEPDFRAQLVEKFAGIFQLAVENLQIPSLAEGELKKLRSRLDHWRQHPEEIPTPLDLVIVSEGDRLKWAMEQRGPSLRSDVPPLARDFRPNTISLPPLHLQTVWGLQRGTLLGIIGGIRAADLCAQLSEAEAELALAARESRLADTIQPRVWGHLILEEGPLIRRKADIAEGCGERSAITETLRTSGRDAPSSGLVLGLDSANFYKNYDRCVSYIDVFTSTLHETDSPALIIAIEDRDLATTTVLIERLVPIIEKRQPAVGLDRFLAGPRHIAPLPDSSDETRIQSKIDSIGHALESAQAGNETELLDFLYSIGRDSRREAIIDRLIRSLPDYAEAFIEFAARSDARVLQVATLRQIHTDDRLLDCFLGAYLSNGPWKFDSDDLLTPQQGAPSTVDGAIIGLMRLRARTPNPALRNRAVEALDKLFELKNRDDVLCRVSHVLDRGLLDIETLRYALAPKKIADVPHRLLWYLFRAGVAADVPAGIPDQLDLRRRYPWWCLFSRGWDRTELAQLLSLPADKRAVFGLCSSDEWQKIRQRELVIQCRCGRSLQWVTR